MDTLTILLFLMPFVLIFVDAWDRDRASMRHTDSMMDLYARFDAEREAWKKERTELMDRIMSVDFVEYKAMTKQNKKAEEKPKPPDFI